MTLYFFDGAANKLIAVDTVTKIARELDAVSFGAATPPFSDEQPPQTDKKVGRRYSATPANRKWNGQGGRKGAGPGCPECGSPSRHRKDCSRAKGSATAPSKMEGTKEWKNLGEVPAPSNRMSRMNFGRVKISQANDIPAGVIARNLDVSPDDVKRAFEAETYDDYQKL